MGFKWRNSNCDGNLPPGSLGWPLPSESLQFFTLTKRTWDTLLPFSWKESKGESVMCLLTASQFQVIVSLEQNNQSYPFLTYSHLICLKGPIYTWCEENILRQIDSISSYMNIWRWRKFRYAWGGYLSSLHSDQIQGKENDNEYSALQIWVKHTM